jgi:hypothetical protein
MKYKVEELLNPQFWQELDKKAGFKNIRNYGEKFYSIKGWENEMHRFIDHIIRGGKIDDFLKQYEE